MDKQTIITLLRKDIAELMQLTEGFDQIAQCPPVLIHLALQKTNSVQQILNELLVLPNTVEKVEKIVENEELQVIKSVEEPVAVQKIQIITEQVETKDETEQPLIEHPLTVEMQPDEVDEVEVEIEEEKLLEKEDETECVEEELEELSEEVEEEIEEKVEEVKEDVLVEEEEEKEVAVNEERVELIAKPEILTRNDSIVNSRIDDISKAISLGDRFLFQRELFSNNGELMQKTIAHLNALTTAEEAMTYLQKKFAWDRESATVERFIQLISRRYL